MRTFVNTVTIPVDKYEEMVRTIIEQEQLIKNCRELLAEAAEPLAEYKSICEYFSERSWERDYYNNWLEQRNKPKVTLDEPEATCAPDTPKPSQDCLTAMAKQSWRDCPKAGE